MDFLLQTLRRGLQNGLRTTWELAVVIVPVYLVVTILKHTPILTWIGRACKPLMDLLGLPGEAVMAVVLGNLLNLYAAIGAVTPLELSSRQVTVFALFLLVSHSLVVETAVSRKTGVAAWPFLLLRLLGGFGLAALLAAVPGWGG
jgi:hypothetical protein